MRTLFLSAVLSVLTIHAADPQQPSQATTYYQQAEYSKAIPHIEQELKERALHLAHCQAAVAFKDNDSEKLKAALDVMTTSDEGYQKGHCLGTTIALANGDLGTTIYCAYFLKRMNENLKKEGQPQIRLHLQGKQSILYALLSAAQVSDTITCGELDRGFITRILPPLGWIDPVHFFEDQKPYLVPDEAAVAHWKNRIDLNKFNVAIAWRPAIENRSLPVRKLLQAILSHDNAHVYLMQGPPHQLITKSAFDALPADEQEKQALNWVPDNLYAQWKDRITLVEEQHGPFVDSLAIASLGVPYAGCGTALLHINACVKNGKAMIIMPIRKDGQSNRYWRMGECEGASLTDEGQQIPGHRPTIRLFERTPTQKNFTALIAVLKQWENKKKQDH